MKRQVIEQKKIFLKYMSEKRLIFGIYKELLYSIQKQQPNFKKYQNISTDTSQKTYKPAKGAYEKGACHH